MRSDLGAVGLTAILLWWAWVPLPAHALDSCPSPGVPQAWSIERPQSPAEGRAPVLVRRQTAAANVSGGDLRRMVLPIADDDIPTILWGDPASPYLYLYVSSADETAQDFRFLALCKSAAMPGMLVNRALKADFPLQLQTESVVEDSGVALAVMLGARRTLLWRRLRSSPPADDLQVLDWPTGVKALGLHAGDSVRLTALTSDDNLLRYELPGAAAAVDPRPVPVAGWRPPSDLGAVPGRSWVRDTDQWTYVMTESRGVRVNHGSGAIESLYGPGRARLVAWDRFYSLQGARTAFFLLFAEALPNRVVYQARVYDLGRGFAEPVMKVLTVTDLLDEKDQSRPLVFLQDWSPQEDFTNVSGFVFHNIDGKGMVDEVQIRARYDLNERKTQDQITRIAPRVDLGQPVLAHQASVLADGRRQAVFYFTPAGGYSGTFVNPVDR